MMCMSSRFQFLVIAAAMTVGAQHLCAQSRDSVGEGPIRSARAAWNAALARRDTVAFRRVLSSTYHATNGFGHLVGPDSAVVRAAQLLRQRPDLEYVLRPTRIRIVASYGVATEYGEWVEHWRLPSGLTEMRGTYFAVWRRYDGRWLIESEIIAPESCTGSDYCKPNQSR